MISPALLDLVAAARTTVVIGEVNRGKTTLVARLATALAGRGLGVGVLDADIGQSEVGPPTTVGLGRVTRPLERLSDAETVALRFVGATSVVRDQLGTLAAIVRLAERARELSLAHLLVDTSGLIRGDLGQRIKQAKLDALDPDLVIALDAAGECEPILAPYRRASRPRIVRVTPHSAARARSADERRNHRERVLAAHFQGARPITLDLTGVALRRPALFIGEPLDEEEFARVAAAGTPLVWGERRGGEVAVVSDQPLSETERRALSRALGAVGFVDHALADVTGMLAGLEDARLDMIALGTAIDIDFARRTLTVHTTADAARVVSVSIGRERAPR